MQNTTAGEHETLRAYLRKPVPQMPPEIRAALSGSHGVTPTPFDRKNDILSSPALQEETGFARLANGNYVVSMTCPMPGVTPEAIRWWFWWHAQKSLRYRIWFPGEHYGISTARADRAWFAAGSPPAFQPNTHYPVERIGRLILPLRIDFVSPESFGFSPAAMRENDIPLIVCGHVGAVYGMVRHTEMAHIFTRTQDGLTLASRFWLGQTLRPPLLRKALLTDGTARGMAAHCCVEYRRLAQILPELYARFGA